MPAPWKAVSRDARVPSPVRCDGAAHRQVVVLQRRAQQGRLTFRGVGTRYERQQIAGGLVYKEEGALLVRGFAKRAGALSARQVSTAASSR